MKTRQFWTLLSVVLVIGFICIGFLLNINESVSSVSSNVVDLSRDIYSIKDTLGGIEYNTMPRY